MFHNVSHYLIYHDGIFKSRVPWFETHQRHCAVSLEKDTLAMVQPREHSDITEISMIIKRYKRVIYNMDIMRQSSCLLVNPITVYSYGFPFNCTTVRPTSDSMMALA